MSERKERFDYLSHGLGIQGGEVKGRSCHCCLGIKSGLHLPAEVNEKRRKRLCKGKGGWK